MFPWLLTPENSILHKTKVNYDSLGLLNLFLLLGSFFSPNKNKEAKRKKKETGSKHYWSHDINILKVEMWRAEENLMIEKWMWKSVRRIRRREERELFFLSVGGRKFDFQIELQIGFTRTKSDATQSYECHTIWIPLGIIGRKIRSGRGFPYLYSYGYSVWARSSRLRLLPCFLTLGAACDSAQHETKTGGEWERNFGFGAQKDSIWKRI